MEEILYLKEGVCEHRIDLSGLGRGQLWFLPNVVINFRVKIHSWPTELLSLLKIAPTSQSCHTG
jgi:hypothetical protein